MHTIYTLFNVNKISFTHFFEFLCLLFPVIQQLNHPIYCFSEPDVSNRECPALVSVEFVPLHDNTIEKSTNFTN